MITEKESRKKRISSPEFRTFVGKGLKHKRDELEYSLLNVNYITSIPVKTLISIEKGEAINIDYYVEYAKALEFDFGSLRDAGIDLKPQRKLPKEDKERINLTKKIRHHIISKNFLGQGKTVDHIIQELIEQGAITKDDVTSIEVAGVMQNFIKDKTVMVVAKNGNKNIYVLHR